MNGSSYDSVDTLNYEDNIFYLHTMIKSIKYGFGLRLERNLLRDKLFEDTFFIDGSLMRFCGKVIGNSHLPNRVELLRSLLRAINFFDELLGACIEKRITDPDSVDIYLPRLKLAREAQRRNLDEIANELRDSRQNEQQTRMVSDQEYEFLLRDEEQEEEEPTSERRR